MDARMVCGGAAVRLCDRATGRPRGRSHAGAGACSVGFDLTIQRFNDSTYRFSKSLSNSRASTRLPFTVTAILES